MAWLEEIDCRCMSFSIKCLYSVDFASRFRKWYLVKSGSHAHAADAKNRCTIGAEGHPTCMQISIFVSIGSLKRWGRMFISWGGLTIESLLPLYM